MKRRYSMWRFRFRGFESKARRRLGKSPDEGEMEAGDWLFIVSAFVALSCNIYPDRVPYSAQVANIVSVLLFLLSIFMKYHRLAPRPCWSRATWASAGIATVWSLLPWLLYLGDDMTYDKAVYLSLCSIAMWVVCLVCFLRLRYIRRRSRITIAMMRMRRSRRKAIY